jgi:hypothetical protein
MKMEYRGYTIDVEPAHNNGRWGAEATILPKYSAPGTLKDMFRVDGYDSKEQAETACVSEAKKRIDKHSDKT